MDVVSRCELPVAGRVWQPRTGAWALAVTCKATLSLGPGTLSLAGEQEPLREVDVPWAANIASLYAASDLVPQKPRPEIVVVGDVYAPRGEPVERLVARIRVGEIDKSLEVACDRTLKPDGTIVAGPRFARSQLLYERAAGGPSTENPVGVDLRPGPYGDIVLPNITVLGARIARDAPLAPIGFGPIAATWPTRSAKGTAARELLSDRWHTVPLPEQDLVFFNAAPVDQQLSQLRGDESITLENLHPEHAQLESKLPGMRLVATIQDAHGERQLPLECDTLWIDTRRAIACLIYRAHIELSTPDRAGRVLVAMVDRSSGPANSAFREEPPYYAAQPFRVNESARPVSRGQLDTQTMDLSAINAASDACELESHGSTRVAAHPTFAAAPSPIGPIPAAPPTSSMSLPQPPASWPQVAVPAMVPALPTSPAALAPPADSPWAVRSSSPSHAFASIEAVKSRESPPGAALNFESVVAAKPSIRDAGEALELVFFDRASVPRLRRVPAWKPLIAELDEKAIDADEDDPTGAKDLEAIEDRREVLEILVHGDVVDASALDQAVSVAVRPDGRYLAPIVLIAGELSTPFDEVETLKATINTACALAATDESLRAAIEDAQEFLKLPAGSSSAAVTESYTTRIRRAFSASKRPVANGYLEAQTERALLEKRHYQRRDVLGGNRQRTALQLPHGAKTLQYVTFLPDSVATNLPLAARFRVRLIARVHLPFDPGEPELVLEALALARLCPIFRRDSK